LSEVPAHVAIIMDGNGRWARERGLRRMAGHRAGTDNIRRIIERFADYGVQCLTLYAFSTENWARPKAEVNGLMSILSRVIRRETGNFHREGIRLRHLGRLDGLSPKLQQEVLDAVELTEGNRRMTVCIAFNYGGRAEILDAVRRLMANGVDPQRLDEASFGRYLYTADVPDPDLIIRTAGEMRISNFLLWQGAYAEFYSTPTFWPDFSDAHVDEALQAYSRRRRRFGGLAPEDENGIPAQKRISRNAKGSDQR
jgi:undecaprenyl diphosphate synthase